WLLFVALCGCQQPTGPPTDLVPTKGRVMIDDKPLAWAIVTLVPTDAVTAATAVTNATGDFELAMLQGHAGARPGEYKVVLTARGSGGYSPVTDQKPTSHPIPQRYTLPDATPLRVSVPSSEPIVLK